ncbi:RIB43A-like with coiled-coils protein 2 isoform X2 [Anolis sagrei]|uniref:RIB43A-like with coiled-coils protein 2 isoform X2 n=1 Tax=Anolis sagrei TaxID=38937 RepID=UPI003521C934
MHKMDCNRQDLAEAMRLQRRRCEELQRQGRLFDARARIIGIDTEALDAQIKDRRIREATQKACDAAIASEMKQNDKILCILDERQKRDALILNKALNEFRQKYQHPETRREFDLTGPQVLKKDTPARLADSDPRCTISGLQKFMGEDLNSEKRWKFQQEQTREWLLEQHKDWQNALADKKYADDLHDQHRLELDNKILNLQRIDGETRRAICVANCDFNKALRLEEEERQRTAEWGRKRIQEARAEVLFERHQQRQNREIRRALDNSNMQLSQEQKARQRHLLEEVYTNFPSGQYYTQFNTTSR